MTMPTSNITMPRIAKLLFNSLHPFKLDTEVREKSVYKGFLSKLTEYVRNRKCCSEEQV
jgi:hypothetical protein